MSLLYFRITLIYLIVICTFEGMLYEQSVEDSNYWNQIGQEQLRLRLSEKIRETRAKNVILFIGDGMGISTVTAGRIFKGQRITKNGEGYKLSFEKFPYTGLSKTYNVDNQVTDSAASATAILSGVKTRNYVVGLDAKVLYKKCNKDKNEISKVKTLAQMAKESGLETGFVTTATISHATPAALYAHVNSRKWECDKDIPREYRSCTKDISQQLIEDVPGRNFKVIMGGGGNCMCINFNKQEKCQRLDGQNLTKIWEELNPGGKVVTNAADLESIDIENTSKILGIFSDSHIPFQASKSNDTPSLLMMTKQAIKILQKKNKGFFLLVEGARIDMAHHMNNARLALYELSDFDNAVADALSMVNLEETLIVVTADHSHTLTINGNSKRGNDILGHTDGPNSYDVLSYAIGTGFKYHRSFKKNSVDDTWIHVEKDPNHNTIQYKNFAGRLASRGVHAGEDVGVYAIGPYSHLFTGNYEQNYIAHAIAYAAQYKTEKPRCNKPFCNIF